MREYPLTNKSADHLRARAYLSMKTEIRGKEKSQASCVALLSVVFTKQSYTLTFAPYLYMSSKNACVATVPCQPVIPYHQMTSTQPSFKTLFKDGITKTNKSSLYLCLQDLAELRAEYFYLANVSLV